jgi:hypothetical protein
MVAKRIVAGVFLGDAVSGCGGSVEYGIYKISCFMDGTACAH